MVQRSAPADDAQNQFIHKRVIFLHGLQQAVGEIAGPNPVRDQANGGFSGSSHGGLAEDSAPDAAGRPGRYIALDVGHVVDVVGDIFRRLLAERLLITNFPDLLDQFYARRRVIRLKLIAGWVIGPGKEVAGFV
jgi:hypothetical protein